MRKRTIVLLIFLVLAILGIVIYFSLWQNDITYVCDYTELSSSPTVSAMVARRLYSSQIDQEKVEELNSTLLTTNFTEDELFEAALKSGKPEFYPWFSFQVSRRKANNIMVIQGKLGQNLFNDQENSKYRFTNVRIEMTSDTSPINASQTVIYGAKELSDSSELVVPVVAGDGSSLAAFLDKAGAYDIALDGGSGTVMIQYTYDICTSDSLIKRTVLKDQILQVYINIGVNAEGDVSASYELVDAYQISDVY